MSGLSRMLFLVPLLSASVWSLPSVAADMSAGKVVDEVEAARGAGLPEFGARRGKGPERTRSDDVSSRALPGDEGALIKAFTSIQRSRDGTEKRIEPGPETIRAIRGDKRADADDAAEPAADPDLGGETARKVVGADNRIRVTNTTAYPYDTVGLLNAVHSKTGTVYNCSAALVGPSTIITAANCIYDHKLEGAWMDQITFWPGINGEKDIPFGGFGWSNATVLEGFVTQYDGTYDSVWLYDMALIELAQPAGDNLGWLGYSSSVPDSGDFEGILVGYQSDKEDWTQWRSACDVLTEKVSSVDFRHDCDADDWSVGAPIYVYLAADKSRRIVGLNMGALGNANWALRITAPVIEWMGSLVK